MLDLPIGVCVSVCVGIAQIGIYPLARHHARFKVMGKHTGFCGRR